MIKSKSVVTTLALSVLMLSANLTFADSMTDTFKDWKKEATVELETIDNDLREFKAELKGDDIEASKQEAIDKVEELYIEVKEELRDARETSTEKAERLKKRVSKKLKELKEKAKDLTS